MAAAKPEKKMVGLKATEKAPRPPPTFALGNYTINKLSTSIILLTPTYVALGVYFGVQLTWSTFVIAVIAYFWNGLGITAGYHRLFAHRAYNGTKALRAVMGFAGSGAFEGSIKWWSCSHRIHHRYIDTDKDPYNANRGFFFSHVGWMIMNQDKEILGQVDIADLNADPFVRFNNKHYLEMAVMSGIVLPVLACGLYSGDWMGGLIYAGFAKMVFVHHCTFFINSLAHSSLFGAKQNFSENHSSHDSLICALLTMGEGYHNFHHEFAQDYRNGIKWYHYDPTKWLIRALEICGQAKNLVRIPNDVIEANVLKTKQAKTDREAANLRKKLSSINDRLPKLTTYTWADVHERVDKGEKLLVVGEYVLDLNTKVPTGSGYTHDSKDTVWYTCHPGGRKVLDMYVGKDATSAVTGDIYGHSQGAIHLFQHLRVATLA